MPEPPMDTITRIDPLTLPEIVDIIAPFLDRKQSLASAARVCKAWNRLYTPHLWRKLSIGSRDSAALNFARHGTHVRQLYLDTLEDSDFDLIAPFCPNIESLALILCKITLERLASYLRTLAPRLKRLRVKTAMACADKLISVLGAESPHQDGGANGGSALEDLRLVFDLFRGELVEISLDALMGLLEARPGLKKISIKWASIRDADAMSSNNRSLGSSMDVAMPMAEELDDGRGLQDNGFVEAQSALTHLSFLAAEIEERTLVRLLGKTPRLASLHIHSNDFLTGDFLTALPTLCPELTHLTMEMCRSIPGSAYMRLFQSSSSSPGHRTLRLEFLRLELCNLDDQSLQYLASTQGDTLLELDLRYCKNVTDSGVMAMLSGCHRLTSLSIYGTSNVSVAIMMEDGPAERWSCYKSLKRLEIHGLGVVELPSRHAEDDPRIEQNREAFRKVQRRIRMLPNLKVLAMNVSGVDEELIQGFLGIEEQEDGLEAGGTRRDDAVETADETGKERLTDEITGEAVTRLYNSTPRTLVGPRLVSLRIWGLKREGLVDNEIDRFVKNYPGLKTAFVYGHTVYFGEMRRRFFDAGIRLNYD